MLRLPVVARAGQLRLTGADTTGDLGPLRRVTAALLTQAKLGAMRKPCQFETLRSMARLPRWTL